MNDSATPSDERQQEGESPSAWKARTTRIREEATLATLKTLGFDTDDINEAQKDMIFLRQLRVASQNTKAKVGAAVITLFFTLAGVIGTLLIQNWFKV